MSQLPRSSKYRSTPGAPLEDAERNAIVDRLNNAFSDGLLDEDAYRRLLDTAFGARTLGEIAPVVEQVPGAVTYDVPAVVESGPGRPGELSEARPPSAPLAILAAGGLVALVIVLVILAVLLFL